MQPAASLAAGPTAPRSFAQSSPASHNNAVTLLADQRLASLRLWSSALAVRLSARQLRLSWILQQLRQRTRLRPSRQVSHRRSHSSCSCLRP